VAIHGMINFINNVEGLIGIRRNYPISVYQLYNIIIFGVILGLSLLISYFMDNEKKSQNLKYI
jgi:hypothetical protein